MDKDLDRVARRLQKRIDVLKQRRAEIERNAAIKWEIKRAAVARRIEVEQAALARRIKAEQSALAEKLLENHETARELAQMALSAKLAARDQELAAVQAEMDAVKAKEARIARAQSMSLDQWAAEGN